MDAQSGSSENDRESESRSFSMSHGSAAHDFSRQLDGGNRLEGGSNDDNDEHRNDHTNDRGHVDGNGDEEDDEEEDEDEVGEDVSLAKFTQGADSSTESQDQSRDDAEESSQTVGVAGPDHSVHFDVSVEEHHRKDHSRPGRPTGAVNSASMATTQSQRWETTGPDEYFSSSSSSRSRGQLFTESGFSSSSSSYMQFAGIAPGKTTQARHRGATGVATGTGAHTAGAEEADHRIYQERFMQMLKDQQRRAESGAGKGGGSYDDLLGQFGALSKDLAKVVARSQKVEDMNAELHEAYDRLKNQHLKLLEKYRDARKMTNAEAEARRRAEHRQDEIVQGLARQLEAKAEEFAELQIQLSLPRDVNVLRQKVQHEVEGAHRAQLYARDRELEKVRVALTKERNAHELLKTEFEQYTVGQEKETALIRAEHQAMIGELNAQIEHLRREMEETSKEEQIRLRSLDTARLRAERDDFGDKFRSTLVDVKNLQIALDEATAGQDRVRLDLMGDLKDLNLEVTRLRRQQEHHEAERRRLEDSLEESNAARLKQQAEVSKLESQLFEASKELEEERSRGSRSLSEASTKAERERHELRGQVESLEAQLARVTARHADQEKLRESQHTAALEEVERARDRALLALEEEKKQRQSAQGEVAELRGRVEIQTREFAETKDRLSDQLNQESSEARRAVKEKEALHERVKVLAVKLEEVQTRATELEEEYRDLQEKHRSALDASRDAKERVQRAESRVSVLDKELRVEQEEKSQLRDALADYNQRVEATQIVVSGKENELKQRLAETLVTQSQKSRRALEKLEKKHAAYHDALVKCKARIKELRAKYQGSRQEVQSLLAARERLQQRTRELERFRDMYYNMRSRYFASGALDGVAQEGDEFDLGSADDEIGHSRRAAGGVGDDTEATGQPIDVGPFVE